MKGKTWKEKLIELIKNSEEKESEYEFLYWLFIFKNKKEEGD